MNAKQLIAAVFALTAASAVFAQQAQVSNVASGKTRAQVVTELQQAQADGSAATYGFVGTNSPAATAGNGAHVQATNAIPTGKTRAQVIAELKDGNAMPTSFVAFDTPAATATNGATTAVAHK